MRRLVSILTLLVFRQGQDRRGRKGGDGKSVEKARGGETDSKGESRLQQSLQEQDAGQRTPRHANDRVMNILQVCFHYHDCCGMHLHTHVSCD